MPAITTGGNVMLSLEDQMAISKFNSALNKESTEFSTSSGAPLPQELNSLINRIIKTVANGGAISITTMPKEFTTTSAASMLGVSRPTVMKYIREGRLTSRKVGSHHRISSRAVIELAENLKDEQRRAVFDLMDLDSN